MSVVNVSLPWPKLDASLAGDAGLNGPELRTLWLINEFCASTKLSFSVNVWEGSRLRTRWQALEAKNSSRVSVRYYKAGYLSLALSIIRSIEVQGSFERPTVFWTHGAGVLDLLVSLIRLRFVPKAEHYFSQAVPYKEEKKIKRKAISLSCELLCWLFGSKKITLSDWHARRSRLPFLNVSIPTRVIPNGVLISEPKQQTSEISGSVCLVGQFTENKNHGFILDVACLAKKHGVTLSFHFLGDGPLRSRFERRVRDQNLSNCHFYGHVGDVEEFMAKMSIICLASIREGTPLCMLQAVFLGKKFISTDVGAIKSILPEADRFSVLSNPSVEEYYAELLRLADLEESGSNMAVEDFMVRNSFSKMAENYRGIFEKK